mmetsp:Transcript_21159/g.43014  ORF Transcript_21159/g.43014 Transcript_21159/m.43014 type:complete len:477 (+) Transcript_21159:3-1433(+)
MMEDSSNSASTSTSSTNIAQMTAVSSNTNTTTNDYSPPFPAISTYMPTFTSNNFQITGMMDSCRARPSSSSSTDQQRSRTVSFVGEDVIPAAATSPSSTAAAVVRGGNGNISNAEKALSPLLLPLSPSRDLSALGIHVHEQISPGSGRCHPARFRHPLFRQELELLEQQQELARQERQEVMRMAYCDSAAAAIITPIPRQPRPILFFGSGNATHGMGTGSTSTSANNSINSNSICCVEDTMNMTMNVNVNTNNNSDNDRQKYSPLELPPLLLNVDQKAKQQQSQQLQQPQERPSTSSGVAPRTRSTKSSSWRHVAPVPTCVRLADKTNKNPSSSSTTTTRTTTATRSKKKTATAVATKKRTKYQHHHTGKKFSWKAYPELEDFLICNRVEYLCFSARNYTIEQRDYNNRLTARLLEHAADSGYPDLFKNCAFSAVRDRIRSYYKSYVQSFKRRKERQLQLRQKALEGNGNSSSSTK